MYLLIYFDTFEYCQTFENFPMGSKSEKINDIKDFKNIYFS